MPAPVAAILASLAVDAVSVAGSVLLAYVSVKLHHLIKKGL